MKKLVCFVGILVLGWMNLGVCGTVTVTGTDTVFTTIHEGINACPIGGTVSVSAGTYTEAVYINKRIALVGVGTPTITAQGLGNTNTVTFDGDSADNALITNFRITGANGNGIYCKRVYWEISAGPTITNNTISGNRDDGINCDSSSPTILNNTITENDHGIYCIYSYAATIANNMISRNNMNGIHCIGCPKLTIANNMISGNRDDGIFCLSSPYSTITNNTMVGNGYNEIIRW